MHKHVDEAWQRCVVRLLPPSSSASSALFDVYIVQRYGEPTRHYHTLAHIEHMFALLQQYRRDTMREVAAATAATDALALELAILFHDAVYDPRASDNEEQSALWLQRFLREARSLCSAVASTLTQPPLVWHDAATAMHVEQTAMTYIRCTASHLASSVHAEDDNGSGALLLDLDLAVLGQSPTAYAEYAACIRREYAHYSDADYRGGRAAFLAGLLQHSRWYKTDYFHDRLEATARRNVTQELRVLRDQAALH